MKMTKADKRNTYRGGLMIYYAEERGGGYGCRLAGYRIRWLRDRFPFELSVWENFESEGR
jgi:hypothetical protein